LLTPTVTVDCFTIKNAMPPQSTTITTRPCSQHRSCVADIAMLAQKIPLFPVERIFQLQRVAKVRTALPCRIGWAAIFLKAYATVVRKTPELRSWYLPGIIPRLATSDDNVAKLAVNRIEDGTDRLCFARLENAEALSLVDIQQFIDSCGSKPIEEMFKRQLELDMLPGPMRRIVLRWNMHSRSPKRASRVGTFSLSTLAGAGASNSLHPTLSTTSLSYAPIEADGRCAVTIIADHRVLDGVIVARSLERLAAELNGTILRELISIGDGVNDLPATDT
jgi:hypothetical protein